MGSDRIRSKERVRHRCRSRVSIRGMGRIRIRVRCSSRATGKLRGTNGECLWVGVGVSVWKIKELR